MPVSANDTLAVPPDRAGRMLGVCGRTVRRMIHRGELRGVRVGSRTWRVPLTEIRRLLQADPPEADRAAQR